MVGMQSHGRPASAARIGNIDGKAFQKALYVVMMPASYFSEKWPKCWRVFISACSGRGLAVYRALLSREVLPGNKCVMAGGVAFYQMRRGNLAI